MINLQFGDFFDAKPNWFDWLSLFVNIFAIAFGFIGAYIIYDRQRKHVSADANELFRDGMSVLKDAIADTISGLQKFSEGLQNPNDEFASPKLNASLNDKIISKVDFTALRRHYVTTKNNQAIQHLTAFNKLTGFIGFYHDYFINDINYFRDLFLEKESQFSQYKLLLNNYFYEITAGRYEPRDNKFALEFVRMHAEIFANRNIIDADFNMLDRNAFNTAFIVPLATMSASFIQTDSMANTINQKANEINSARVDINALKESMKTKVDADIIKLNELFEIITKF